MLKVCTLDIAMGGGPGIRRIQLRVLIALATLEFRVRCVENHQERCIIDCQWYPIFSPSRTLTISKLSKATRLSLLIISGPYKPPPLVFEPSF